MQHEGQSRIGGFVYVNVKIDGTSGDDGTSRDDNDAAVLDGGDIYNTVCFPILGARHTSSESQCGEHDSNKR